jgi:predicted enzyme related to lactoylglutathione lyase
VDFLKDKEAQAPTECRTLDHIGFEVKDLEPFCKKLAADGIACNTPRREVLIGLKSFIVDPVGTHIDLTQGLEGK